MAERIELVLRNIDVKINLNEDAALSGVLIYRLRVESENWIGVNPPAVGDGEEGNSRIIIGGMGVMSKHACLTRGRNAALMLSCMPGARTLVNGVKLVEKVGVKVRSEGRHTSTGRHGTILRKLLTILFSRLASLATAGSPYG